MQSDIFKCDILKLLVCALYVSQRFHDRQHRPNYNATFDIYNIMYTCILFIICYIINVIMAHLYSVHRKYCVQVLTERAF